MTGQVDDNLMFPSDTNVPLFAFRLVPGGESATINSLTFSLSGVNNILVNDVSNIRLYRDLNSNALYDAGDVAVGGAGILSLTGRYGTIGFSTSFTSTTSQNYLLVLDTLTINNGDYLFISLNSSNINATGVSSLESLALGGSVASAEHRKGGQNDGGGRGEVEGPSQQGNGIQSGGGNDGGAGMIDGDTGESLGSEPGSNAPSSQGAPFGGWTNGGEARSAWFYRYRHYLSASFMGWRYFSNNAQDDQCPNFK